MDCILNVLIGMVGIIVLILVIKGVGLMYPKKKEKMHGFWMRRVK